MRTYTARQLLLIKNTVARNCSADEFNLFIEVARAKSLDPLIGQIIPLVLGKVGDRYRKMTILVSRDGQRAIAQRCGDYRAASRPPVYRCDKTLKSKTNPHGMILGDRDPLEAGCPYA